MDDTDDPYKILGVTSDASAADIKKAYRTLALKNHPDKQNTEEEREKASAIFAKIAAAYEILSDDEERRQYDMRKKYGGAPGTRYTTTDNCSNNTTRSPTGKTTTTTSRSYSTPKTPKSSGQPESGTFKFSYDPSKVKSSNPYDIFKEVFGSDFQNEFPGAVITPSKSQLRTNVSPTTTIISPTTVNRPRKNVVQQQVTTRNSAMDSNDIISMSKSTRTICHPDGSHEIITETKITKADGSTSISSESSRSVPTSSSPTRKPLKTLSPPGRNYMVKSVSRK